MKRLLLLCAAASGCAAPEGPGITRRDSAGIEIVEVTPAAFASLPQWTIDTTVSLMTFGGGETPEQDIELLRSVHQLEDGRWLVAVVAPAEVRTYTADGKYLARLAREGMGPGEVQGGATVFDVRGDTVVVYDFRYGRLTELTTDGSLVRVVNLATLPITLWRQVFGVLRDGRPVSAKLWGEEPGASDGRTVMPVSVLSLDGATADTLASLPGYHVVMAEMSEGGRTFTTATTPRFDGPSAVASESDGFLAALPDSAVILRVNLDRSTRRITRLPMTPRAVTPELAEREIAAESTSIAQRAPAYAKDFGANTRKTPLADHFALFERIHRGPDGERWLERAWTSVDSTKEYVILDPTGAPTATLILPMDRTLWWIDRDWILASWRDEDGSRHLSKHPLHRTPAPR